MKEPMVRTSIVVPQRIWTLLRSLAERRALEEGGRPSVSAMVAALAEKAVRADPPHVE